MINQINKNEEKLTEPLHCSKFDIFFLFEFFIFGTW